MISSDAASPNFMKLNVLVRENNQGIVPTVCRLFLAPPDLQLQLDNGMGPNILIHDFVYAWLAWPTRPSRASQKAGFHSWTPLFVYDTKHLKNVGDFV